MAKPAGARCNLDCAYCFYTEKTGLFPLARPMDEAMLERYVCDHMAAQPGDEVTFYWQGGEPILLGLDYFRHVVALQRRHAPAGKRIANVLQTNGVLIDDAWAGFLAEHGFLVGLSLDGPRRLHDRHRRDHQGRSSFDAVLAALACLQRHGVAVNTLTVVHRDNSRHGREIYRFLKRLGVEVMQFIPLVERLRPEGGLAPPPGPANDSTATVAPWSVPPGGYGAFLCEIFDDWVKTDVGRIFVQPFDIALALWAGLPSPLCVFAETCGDALALEHDGSVYACDHYVYPEYRLGRLDEIPLVELAASPAQRAFGLAKRETLPTECRACPFLFACHGGCPKHRIAAGAANHLCPSYRRFFAHIAPTMTRMVALLEAGRAPAEVMFRPTPGAAR